MKVDSLLGEGEECERVAFRYQLLVGETKDEAVMLMLRKPADGDNLTCFAGVDIFGLRLKPGTTHAEATQIAALLQQHGLGWEAIYKPSDPHPRPTYPNLSDAKVVVLRKAA